MMDYKAKLAFGDRESDQHHKMLDIGPKAVDLLLGHDVSAQLLRDGYLDQITHVLSGLDECTHQETKVKVVVEDDFRVDVEVEVEVIVPDQLHHITKIPPVMVSSKSSGDAFDRKVVKLCGENTTQHNTTQHNTTQQQNET